MESQIEFIYSIEILPRYIILYFEFLLHNSLLKVIIFLSLS